VKKLENEKGRIEEEFINYMADGFVSSVGFRAVQGE
jgi:hypothetical protein